MAGDQARARARDARIAIVGAGAGGLTVAHALRANGYTRVTVLERDDQVGGKCCTVAHGDRTYELGAALMTTAYTNVRSLMKEVGLKSSPQLSGAHIDLDSGALTYRPPIVREAGYVRVALELARLGAEVMRRRALREPGFAAVEPDACQPFDRWARAHGLAAAAKIVEPWFTAFGYGYLDQMPAAYVLKYLTLTGPFFELHDGGYRALWEAIARPLDVRTGTTIQRIERPAGASPIRVHTSDGVLDFDSLVLAASLADSPTYLDASADERALFGKVRTNDYRVVLAAVDGLPDPRWVFVPDHLSAATCGHVMFWYKRWPDRNVYAFYLLERDPASTSSIAPVEAAVRRLGCHLRDVIVERRWRYFPHVSPGDMIEGFYDRLEALQGTRGTYYAGELPALGTVETVVAYSRALVARYFA